MRGESLSSYLLHLLCCYGRERVPLSGYRKERFHIQEVMHTGLNNARNNKYVWKIRSWIVNRNGCFEFMALMLLFLLFTRALYFCAIRTTARRQTCGMFPSHFSLLWGQPAALKVWTRRHYSTVSDGTERCTIITLCPCYPRASRLHLWELQRLHWLCELRGNCRSHSLWNLWCFFNVIK